MVLIVAPPIISQVNKIPPGNSGLYPAFLMAAKCVHKPRESFLFLLHHSTDFSISVYQVRRIFMYGYGGVCCPLSAAPGQFSKFTDELGNAKFFSSRDE
jgi:hypothetical protein